MPGNPQDPPGINHFASSTVKQLEIPMAEQPQVILSGFADEAAIDKTVDQQFSAFAALGLRYLTIRFIDAGNGVKNVMQLTDDEVDRVKSKLDTYGLAISSIGSPIGKVKLLDVEDGTSNRFVPFEAYLENDVQRAIELARTFDTKLIRGFSFYHPKGSDVGDHLDLAVEQLSQITQACEANDVIYGMEVEANLVGQNGEILAEIHRRVNSQSLVLIFDGGNLVTQGFTAEEVFEQYQLMKPGLGWIHIKDFRNPSGQARVNYVDEDALRHYVPADIGESGYPRIMADLADFLPELQQRMVAQGVPGVFADLEPHVKGGGQFGGFSGPDGFGVALRAFEEVCQQSGVGIRRRDFTDVQRDRGF